MRILSLTLLLTLSAAAQTPPVTLHGGGLDVSVDLAGWQTTQGTSVLRGDYVRLGLFTKQGESVGIFVDHLPKGMTTVEEVCRMDFDLREGEKGLAMVEAKGFAGKNACLWTLFIPTVARSLYVDAVVEGKWLQFSYSTGDAPDALARGRKTMERIVASLRATSYQMSPRDLLTSDVPDTELARVEQVLKCASKAGDYICRHLAAFRKGRTPVRPTEVIGLPGVAITQAFFNNVEPVEPMFNAASLTLSPEGGRLANFFATGKDREAGQELVRLMRAGQPVPEDNAAMVFVRSQKQKKVDPFLPAGSSVVLSGDLSMFMRATGEGYVLFKLTGDKGFSMAVFPVAQPR